MLSKFISHKKYCNHIHIRVSFLLQETPERLMVLSVAENIPALCNICADYYFKQTKSSKRVANRICTQKPVANRPIVTIIALLKTNTQKRL